jgi:hypothetical protein
MCGQVSDGEVRVLKLEYTVQQDATMQCYLNTLLASDMGSSAVVCILCYMLSRVGYVTRQITSRRQDCSEYLLCFASTLTHFTIITTCSIATTASTSMRHLNCPWSWLDPNCLVRQSHIATDGQSVSL